MSEEYTPLPWTSFSADGVETLMPAMRPGEICTGLTPEDSTRILLCVNVCAGTGNAELYRLLGWPDPNVGEESAHD